MNKKIVIRVYELKKLAASVFVIFMIFAVILFGNIFAGNKTEIEFDNYYVKTGDTMWNIAGHITPENKDIREVVYDIEKLNNKKSGEIKPGDNLYLPVYR